MIKGTKMSDESRLKLSLAHIGQTAWNKGLKLSQEYREKLSKAHLGKNKEPLSEEHKRKISNALKGLKKSPEAIENNRKSHIGKKLSDKTKLKMSLMKRGDKHPMWRGGRAKHRDYITVWTDNGYIKEHRFIMEKHLGKKLNSKEVIHHINKIRDDNRIENLMLFNNQREHMIYHQLLLRNSLCLA